VLGGLGELILLGLRRADVRAAATWRELARFGAAVGFDRLALPVATLARALAQKSETKRWDIRSAARLVLEAAALVRLALDLSH
jgi:hypothetical protein